MYSVIPMPKIEWEKKNMKYIFIFFPFIGLTIGLFEYIWYNFSQSFELNNILTSAVMLIIPIIISGGIHLDGLIDTCDAIFSYGDKEKKLEIMKDPRTGAFGVIGCCVYFIMLFGTFNQLIETPEFIFLVIFIFVISRCVSAIALLTVKKAKSSGLGATFSDSSGKTANMTFLILYLLLTFIFIFYVNIFLSIIILITILLYISLYIYLIKKHFGGITGDLTGFLIMSTELLLVLIIAIGGKIC